MGAEGDDDQGDADEHDVPAEVEGEAGADASQHPRVQRTDDARLRKGADGCSAEGAEVLGGGGRGGGLITAVRAVHDGASEGANECAVLASLNVLR